jgi:predicted transposase YbfD/YdcC
VRLRREWVKQHLGLERDSLPCAGTYTYVLEHVDAEELTQGVRDFLTRLQSPKQSESVTLAALQEHQEQTRHLALDGKTLRRPLKHERADQPAHHLLALYEVATGTVLAQRQVGEKENEISAAPPMLHGQWLQGRLISSDAMQTQVKFCQLLHRLHADGLFIAKDNQPQLHEDLALYFEDRQADRSTWRTSIKTTKGHGRLETHIVTTTADLTSLSSRPLLEAVRKDQSSHFPLFSYHWLLEPSLQRLNAHLNASICPLLLKRLIRPDQLIHVTRPQKAFRTASTDLCISC